jgi:hypothetical protein
VVGGAPAPPYHPALLKSPPPPVDRPSHPFKSPLRPPPSPAPASSPPPTLRS